MRNYIYSLMTNRALGFVASVLNFILYLASFLYLFAINIISGLRSAGLLPTVSLGARVISIGNLTLGGTGKTPLVEFVARYLFENKKRPAILTRGYRIGKNIADEPVMLAANLPGVKVLVGPGRAENGRKAISEYRCNILLLDDGFQHRGLKRDLDILTIDATNPFGNGKLLPRGILREPISGAGRADIAVITKADAVSLEKIEGLKGLIQPLNPNALLVVSIHKPARLFDFGDCKYLSVDSIAGKDVVCVSGIAGPDYFIKTVQGLGAVVKESVVFCDHHPYSLSDLEDISSKAVELAGGIIVTTEKDLARLGPLIKHKEAAPSVFRSRFLAVGIEIEITENKEAFLQRILQDEG